MRIDNPKNDNVMKLLDGVSLLDDQDQDRVIRMVDALEVADKNVKEMVCGVPLKAKTTSAYVDDVVG